MRKYLVTSHFADWHSAAGLSLN